MTAPAGTAPAADATTTTTTAAPTGSVIPAGATVAGTPGAATITATTGGETEADRVSKLPDWAQRELREAREDATKARTDAKKAAADEARLELSQTIGKALGLVKDGEPADPAKLQEAITEREGTIQEQARELAVYKAVGTDVSASKLLDSRSFLKAIKDIDPADDAKIKAAIDKAVQDNAAFKTTAPRAGGVSGADFTGGTGGPTDIQSRIAAAEKAGDFKTAIALKQQLNT